MLETPLCSLLGISFPITQGLGRARRWRGREVVARPFAECSRLRKLLFKAPLRPASKCCELAVAGVGALVLGDEPPSERSSLRPPIKPEKVDGRGFEGALVRSGRDRKAEARSSGR
jgi:hypothetical protein